MGSIIFVTCFFATYFLSHCFSVFDTILAAIKKWKFYDKYIFPILAWTAVFLHFAYFGLLIWGSVVVFGKFVKSLLENFATFA